MEAKRESTNTQKEPHKASVLFGDNSLLSLKNKCNKASALLFFFLIPPSWIADIRTTEHVLKIGTAICILIEAGFKTLYYGRDLPVDFICIGVKFTYQQLSSNSSERGDRNVDSGVNVVLEGHKGETGLRPLSAGAGHSVVHRVPGSHLLFIPRLPCGEQVQQGVCHLC